VSTPRRFGAYHRVSQANGRDIEADSTMTDKVAWQRIEGWAASAGVEIVERYLDWDTTGSKLERPQLDRVIADLKAGKIDGIAVARTDRFSRASVADALRLVGQIQEMKPGSLALLDLGVDPTTPTGELMLTLLLAIARMQWRQFKDTWATAQTRAVDRGVYVAKAPFGYRHDGKLMPDENAPIVREAFRIAAGEGFRAAMKHLAKSVPDKTWTTTDARRMLTRRAYLGEARVGELINPEAHDALTTPELFAAVQALPDMTARPRKTNGRYPLSGLVVCGKCDGRLVGNLQNVDYKSKPGAKIRRYRCPRGCMAIDADPLEAFVKDRLGVALAAVKAIRVKTDEGNGLAAARDRLDLATGDLQRWATDDRTRDVIGEAAYYAGLEQRQTKVNEAEDVLAEVAGKGARAQVISALMSLEDDAEQFERALRAMVKSVLIAPARFRMDGDRATIGWTDDVVEELGRGNQNPFETTASEDVVKKGRQAIAEGLRQQHPGSLVEVGND
jgi:DNA invertase Pin-like site-specific DNA recombinase